LDSISFEAAKDAKDVNADLVEEISPPSDDDMMMRGGLNDDSTYYGAYFPCPL